MQTALTRASAGPLPTSRRSPAGRRPVVAVKAVAQTELQTVLIKAQRITPENFAPFGQVGDARSAHALHNSIAVQQSCI